jgi:hypothetical protein
VAASIGHLSLIIGIQSGLGEQLAREEAKIRKFAGQASKDMQGIKGPNPAGIGGKGSDKMAFAGGVANMALGGPFGQLMGATGKMGAAGMAVAMAFSMVNKVIEDGNRIIKEMAAGVREVESVLGSAADRADALRTGLLPADSEELKRMENERKKAEKPGAWTRFKKDAADLWNVTWNMMEDGFGRDIQGIAPVTADQVAAQEAEQKQLMERLKATKALRDSMNDERAAIGKTAREAEILKLAKQGMSNADRDALLASAKLTDEMRKQSEAAQKLKDDGKAYFDELYKGIDAIGKTADQVKIDELFGGDKGMHQFATMGARVRAEMQAGFALVERNPMEALVEQLNGIDELSRRGTITAQQAADASEKARKGFLDKGASALAAGPAFLERGSAAEANYLKQLEVEQAQRELMEGQLAQQRQQAGLQADANKLLGDVVNAVQKQVVIKVLGV